MNDNDVDRQADHMHIVSRPSATVFLNFVLSGGAWCSRGYPGDQSHFSSYWCNLERSTGSTAARKVECGSDDIKLE